MTVVRDGVVGNGVVAVTVDRRDLVLWHQPGQASALDGPLVGLRLTPVTSFDTFWFSWVGFRPDTRLIPPREG